jgi:hypothetical protein
MDAPTMMIGVRPKAVRKLVAAILGARVATIDPWENDQDRAMP